MDLELKKKREKLTTNTYMREALKYQIIIIKEDPDYFITIKKYDEVTEPFILTHKDGKRVTYFDKGYYLVEFTPLNDNYNIRFYYTPEKNYINYYIDISLENGTKYKLPYYTDLYLDVLDREGEVSFEDEDELKEALEEGKITKEEYDFAYLVGNRIKEEIKNGKNKFVNIDKVEILNRYFK